VPLIRHRATRRDYVEPPTLVRKSICYERSGIVSRIPLSRLLRGL
jgi:hypothetical protein